MLSYFSPRPKHRIILTSRFISKCSQSYTHTAQIVTNTLSPTAMYVSSACLLTHPTQAPQISARLHNPNPNKTVGKSQDHLTRDKPNSDTLPTLDSTDLEHLNPHQAAFAKSQQEDYWCRNLIKYLM